MATTNSLPSVSDVRAVWASGPEGAALAGRWIDAMIAGASITTPGALDSQHAEPIFTARSTVPATDPERYGWRFLALRPDGMLVSPFQGQVIEGATLDAICRRGCESSPDPHCDCGVHYFVRARDVLHYTDATTQRTETRFPPIQRVCAGEWAPAFAYGVGIGRIEVDRQQFLYFDLPSRRSARWTALAIVSPGAGPKLRASLRERYGCKVSTDASLRACEALAGRLESSVTPARGRTSGAPLIR